uniref:Uncharacterized protein n=1 Tax=Chelonoidis abingdonii TaxID=106734 RepID=A0A8C0J4E4_CHEAB
MVEALLIHQPEDPISFMIDHLKQDSDHVPRVFVLGPPAAGKTTIQIPDELWVSLLQDRLLDVDCVREGWVLDGFPQTREQALLLQTSGIVPRHVVVLYAPDTVLVERNLGKRVDPVSTEVYHTTFDWPTDPTVEQRLVQPNGCSEQATAKRLLEYHRNIQGIFHPIGACNEGLASGAPPGKAVLQLSPCLSFPSWAFNKSYGAYVY